MGGAVAFGKKKKGPSANIKQLPVKKTKTKVNNKPSHEEGDKLNL